MRPTLSIVKGKVFSDNSGMWVEMPVLISERGPVRSIIDYFLTVRRSLAWQEKLVYAAKLFVEYSSENLDLGDENWRIFRNFRNALISGTINPDSFIDPTNLYWLPASIRDCNYYITLLSDFFDWVSRDSNSPANSFNPAYGGNLFDQQIAMHAHRHRRSKAFLGHSWSNQHSGNKTRLIGGERSPKVLPERPPMFPEERFEELLFKGFRVGDRWDYRGMLITLLMFGGGLRVSEPFHMFIADVQPHWDDPTNAFVAVHHPSLGYAPNEWRNAGNRRGSRREYLAAEFGMTPRHLVRGKIHAGWKQPALDGHWFMQVYWFPEIFGRWFMQIWALYMEQIISVERMHPYAWINISQNQGKIYTIDQFQNALKNAVERVGLIFGKVWGTTAHGSRHAYGQRVRRAGIDSIIIQRLMHHTSPESQLVYTQPQASETMTALRTGIEILGDEYSHLRPILARLDHYKGDPP